MHSCYGMILCICKKCQNVKSWSISFTPCLLVTAALSDLVSLKEFLEKENIYFGKNKQTTTKNACKITQHAKLYAYWVNLHAFLPSADFFFKINFFEKFYRNTDVSSVLIWFQTVCKGYQQTTLVGKELIHNVMIEILFLSDSTLVLESFQFQKQQ